jgi:transposase
MRTLPKLGAAAVGQLDAAWRQEQPAWARERLRVLRLVARHELTAAQIAAAADVCRASVFNYVAAFQAGGVAGLLRRGASAGRPATVSAPVQAELVEGLRTGRWRRAADAQRWLAERTGRKLALTTIYYWLGKVGGVLKVPRKAHTKQDPARVAEFRATLAQKLGAVSAGAERVRVWVADEHRYGLLPVIRRVWALRGVRVVAPYATKYQWGYLYEALEVDGANAAELLFVPAVDKEVSAIFLRQISASDPTARHVVIWDQAGFHPQPDEAVVPGNVRLVPLPPYSPELNPVEKLGDIWKDHICNRVFTHLRVLEDEILAALQPFRTDPARVAQLIGDNWLTVQANSSVPT